ncbi:hypothetical protein GCM10028801_34160 [Nocardioides maradonensis]
MSWVALLLIGLGVTDLVHSLRHRPVVPECVGAVTVVAVALLAGLVHVRDLAAVVLLVVVTLAWGRTVTRGFGRNRPAVPLTLLALALLVTILCSPWADAAGGPLRHWLDDASLPVLSGMSADHFLVVLGAALVQLSTGNVVVRLVLSATHTISPMKQDAPSGPEQELKGGRLLGPMERLVIFGFGLSGALTAAGVVIAAKGLLRFPELQSRRGEDRIHLLTEYFLVGSFVSWIVALGALVLAQ